MFAPTFTDSALGDIRFFKRFEQVLILDAIARQLLHEPARETRNRKLLEPNLTAQWELRIGKYRVFYDVEVEDLIVKIKAIAYKERNRLFIRGREFNL